MNRFDYVRPASVADAIGAAAREGAKFLGAGTNLIDLMKGGVERPTTLVDVTHLPGLDAIETLDNGDVRIGALVKNADLAFDADFAKSFPGGRRGAAVGGIAAIAQRGDRRRQFAPADAVPLFLRYGECVQQARAGLGVRRVRGRQPAPRGAGLERGVYRDTPVRFLRAARRARCGGRGRGANGSPRRAAGRSAPAAGRSARDRNRSRTRRPDRRGAAARGGEGVCGAPTLSEGARTHLLRLRARLRRGGTRSRRRHDPGGAVGAGRGGAKAMARDWKRRRRWQVPNRPARISSAPQRPRWPRRGHRATMATRSTSRAASSCAR